MQTIGNDINATTIGEPNDSPQLPGAVTALVRPCYAIARLGLQVLADAVAPVLHGRAVWRNYEKTLLEADTVAARLLDDRAAADRAERLRARLADEVRDTTVIDARLIDLDVARERRRNRAGTARLEHYRRIHDAQIAAHRHPAPIGGK